MKNSKSHTCCFLGHRKIAETEALKVKLYTEIENLITNNGVTNFLFGSNSQFDSLCHEIVSQLQKKYMQIKRIYVRAEFPYINDVYKEYLLKDYEDTYYPEKIINAGKSVYVERNFEMLNNSSYCICYYDKSYSPPRRKNRKQSPTDYQPKSGTAIAYAYAVKKKLKIINLLNSQNTQNKDSTANPGKVT